jgi:hypothetical protein
MRVWGGDVVVSSALTYVGWTWLAHMKGVEVEVRFVWFQETTLLLVFM